jgi:hypothetical protein
VETKEMGPLAKEVKFAGCRRRVQTQHLLQANARDESSFAAAGIVNHSSSVPRTQGQRDN